MKIFNSKLLPESYCRTLFRFTTLLSKILGIYYNQNIKKSTFAIHEFRIMRSFQRSESYLKAGISDFQKLMRHISQNSVRNLTLYICKELRFVATVVSWLMSAFIKVGLEYNRELAMVTVALYKTRLRQNSLSNIS